MTPMPETRESLLVRLRDAADAAAWDEFVSLYRPMIFRLALRKGLQDSDADDLAQQVLMSVARTIDRWERDATRGGFRSWLRTVARNAIVNLLQRGPREMTVGGSDFLDLCNSIPAGCEEIERLVDEEYQRSVLRTAALRIQRQVHPTTWKSFCMTTLDEMPPEATAEALGVSIGKVYGARSRVLKLLQRAAREIDANWEVTNQLRR